MLTVTDIKAAAAFYQKAPGFTRRGGFMNGPDGKPTHAELRLRDTTLMLGPEGPQARSAKSIGLTLSRHTVSHDGSCRQSYRQSCQARGKVARACEGPVLG